MKTFEPKTIYLQIGEDANITEFKEGDFEKGGITWCWEKMFENDIEYISQKSILELIDGMIAKKPNLFAYLGYSEALIELKQKLNKIQ